MRIAIVHHWFVTRGGGERVAECIASLFPQAEVFTLLSRRSGIPEGIRLHPLHNSFLQHVPLATDYHRHMMPLYAPATESLDLRGFDLIISSDSGPVKGVRIDPDAIHICYCHSPMRYLYDGYDAYRNQMSGLTRSLFTLFASRLRRWDQQAAQRVTAFIANSNYVADRIRRSYGRDSVVIHPPIDMQFARQVPVPGQHYLCAGRLVGYKRTELMLEACIRLGRPLKIAGIGPEESRLRRMATGHNVEFLGELPTDALWQQYAECRALLFAADEDFGMVPLEAQACGRPVVAYGVGGTLETVRGWGRTDSQQGATGVYFAEQTVESVMDGIQRYEQLDAEGAFRPDVTRAWAETFRTEIFLANIRRFVLSLMPAAEPDMSPTVVMETI